MKKAIQIILGIVCALYISVILLLNIPFIQQKLSVKVSNELSSLLETEVSIGKIDMGLLNRIILEDIQLNDQSHQEMLKVARLAARFEIMPLFKNKISVNNIQLYGFNANLEKKDSLSESNFQFIVDKLASKDSVKKESNIDLRINSVLIRRGKVSYHLLSAKETPGQFNVNHLQLRNLAANISIKALNPDSLNASVKRLSVEDEQSSFKLDNLNFKIRANKDQFLVKDFNVCLPNTLLTIDTVRANYKEVESIDSFAEKAHFSFHLKPSTLTLSDISAFVPALKAFHSPLALEIKANGYIDSLQLSRFSVHSPDNHFQILGKVSLNDLQSAKEANLQGNLQTLYADSTGIDFIVKNLSDPSKEVPTVLKNLGKIQFKGDIAGKLSDLHAKGLTETNRGRLISNLRLSSDKKAGLFAYAGKLETADFELGKTISSPQLGNVTFNLQVDGKHYSNQSPSIIIKGVVDSLNYNSYTYKNIFLDGEVLEGGFNGKISLNDRNGQVLINGTVNPNKTIPVYDFYASIDNFRPNDLKLSKKYPDTSVSFRLRANFRGKSLEHINGEINLDSLYFTETEDTYFLDNLNVTAHSKLNGEKEILLSSDFLNGNLTGNYSYATLPGSFMDLIYSYLPSLNNQKSDKQTHSDNQFHLHLNISPNNFVTTIFKTPLTFYAQSTIHGDFNEKSRHLRFEGYFPRLNYQDKFLESAMFLIENPHKELSAHIRLNNRKKTDYVNLVVGARAKNDSVDVQCCWGNSDKRTYSGEIAALAHIFRNSQKSGHTNGKKTSPYVTDIQVRPTNVVLNDTLWEIHPSKITVNSGKIHIDNFYFGHPERHLQINGTISEEKEDTVRLKLKDINLAYVFEIADLGVDFSGKATGPAFACHVLKNPFMKTDLFVKDLGLNKGLLGDAHIHGEWHHQVEGIHLDAYIQEADIAKTHVLGYVYPIKPTSALDLQIDANKTNLKFIHQYLESITPEFEGRATGDVHLFGKFKGLSLQGKVKADASMKIDVLNTTYNIKDSILLAPTGLTFKNNRIFDSQGNQGIANGYVHFKYFKDIDYRFEIDAKNMLLMDTKESLDVPFYGRVFGTGNVLVHGNPQSGLNLDVGITTNKNSTFTYFYESVSSAASNQFITFVDKTPNRNVLTKGILTDFDLAQQEENKTEDMEGDIRLNLQLDVTPDLNTRIIMDPVAGDHIACKGYGNIRTEFYNKGDIRMFGNYQITQGMYRFSVQEIIRKDFNIINGSSISFSGQAENANLDIHAKHTVPSVSLNDLMPNASSYVEKTNIKVDCIMNLTGPLSAPKLNLGIDIPNERDEVQALVKNYIPTDEQMNMQMLYLLSIGKFYTPDNVDNTQNTDMMSSVLSSTLSGQLNNAISNIINSNDWIFGTNLSTGEKGWTDMEFETMLSGQLLNNRLRINGNFGYRDNPLANTNFVGDFEAEWLVTPSGDIKLRAYNETNDRYYTKTNLTTQGIGIIFSKDFNRWKDLFFWNRWKVKRAAKKLQSKTLKADNIK